MKHSAKPAAKSIDHGRFGYARVSTRGQTLEVQLAALAETEGLELGDEGTQPSLVIDPRAVVVQLLVAHEPGDGLGRHLAGPLVIGTVQYRGFSVAAAVGLAAARQALGHRPGQDKADLGEGTGDAASLSLLGGGGWHRSTLAPGIHQLGHIRKYIYCMTEMDLSAWVPRGVDERAGAFARAVVARVAPPSWSRARSLLWAASRLGAFALCCGLDPEPSVVLSSALIERFILVGTQSWSPAARRPLLFGKAGS